MRSLILDIQSEGLSLEWTFTSSTAYLDFKLCTNKGIKGWREMRIVRCLLFQFITSWNKNRTVSDQKIKAVGVRGETTLQRKAVAISSHSLKVFLMLVPKSGSTWKSVSAKASEVKPLWNHEQSISQPFVIGPYDHIMTTRRRKSKIISKQKWL